MKHYCKFYVLMTKRRIFLIKYLGIGLLITIVAAIIGVETSDWDLFIKITGVAAIVPLLLSGLLSGAFVGGDRIRANFNTETKKDRKIRSKWVYRFLLISLPNICLLIILIIIGLT
jgi:hypothetical protein